MQESVRESKSEANGRFIKMQHAALDKALKQTIGGKKKQRKILRKRNERNKFNCEPEELKGRSKGAPFVVVVAKQINCKLILFFGKGFSQ